jgi:alkylation response protein AidB-like acyl-CoA dehydrogenase
MSPKSTPTLFLEPSDEELALRSTVAAIVGEFGPKYYRECTESGRGPEELWSALAKQGFLGVHLPEEYGGGGQGLTALAAVLEESAAQGCPVLFMVVSPGIIGLILARHGTVEQKDRWLRGIAEQGTRVAFAITESDAGSNTQNNTTSARRAGDTWLINGQKTYISGADDAEAILVVTRTGVDERSGRPRLSLFMVDADAPGLHYQPIPTNTQMPERQFTLFFDDVEVTDDRLVGGEGGGLGVAFDGLNPERILVAALATGIGRYALAKGVAYAGERSVWGVPIGQHQGVAHPLAEAHIAVELARLMTHKAATLYDCGLDAGEASNMAKFAAADAGLSALDRAIQTHGGNGMAVDYDLANYWGLSRLLRIAPVSREMILNFVAQHTLGLPRGY